METLQESRRSLLEYESILENAWIGILFTRDRNVLHCNPRFSEIFGWPHGELVGKPGSVFYSTQSDYADIGRRAGPVLSTGGLFDAELTMARKDGSEFLCHLRAKAINPADTSEGTIWIAEDVTESKRFEQVLQKLLLEQCAILDNVLVGIVFLQQRMMVSCNRRFEEIFGYQRGELDNCSTRVIYPDDQGYVVGSQAYRDFAEGRTHEREQILMKKDGTQFWCHLYGREVEPGNPSKGSVWLFEDITERKRDQEALLRARDELEERVRERTAELAAANARLQEEILERRQAEERVRHLADHDALTGLPNRRLLQDRLEQALALAHRNGLRTAVLFLDLDRFKTVNDSLGHEVGDQLLCTVAQRLTAVLREGDTVARMGGDEFVVILPELESESHPVVVAAKLITALSQPVSVRGYELRVTPSIGISMYPNDGDTAEVLLRNADAAMYHAKDMGRSNYQFFTAKMNLAAAQRLQMENDLHRALQREEFVLYYQPRVDSASGEMRGLEALIRWRHPEKGMVAPARFIPLAEETGLIVPIGEWVLREACSQAVRWQREHFRPLPLSVNLSPRQFRQRGLADLIRRILTETGLDPQLLVLEITEGSLMEHSDDIMETLRGLHELQVTLSIDDFGIGYSSLSYLKRFPVDELKIDRSFVRDVPEDADDCAIVSAIVALGQTLDLRVVAEGVETPEQLDFLARCGCQEAQGFYFSPPLPVEEIVRLLPRTSQLPL